MKVAVLLVCRLNSQRLKEKALKEINGLPMISHIINRIKLANIPENIILCTTDHSEDNRLEEIAIDHNIKCFRGDSKDVLLRISKAADFFNVQNIIVTTGDNPWVDPIYMDKLIESHIENCNDFTNIKGLPWGTFSYAISPKATKKCLKIKLTNDTEVWHGYFIETGIFKCGKVDVTEKELIWPELRLTVDTEEDFLFTKTIFDKLYKKGKIIFLRDIINMLKNNSELLKINSLVNQKPSNPILYNI